MDRTLDGETYSQGLKVEEKELILFAAYTKKYICIYNQRRIEVVLHNRRSALYT